jgi:hypothetical protein
MKNQDFKISVKIVWLIVVADLLMTILGTLARIQNWEYSQIFQTVGLMLLFATWVIVLSDMAKNRIFNKEFWIISMFILPTISPLFYLIQRNKLARLGSKFEIRN